MKFQQFIKGKRLHKGMEDQRQRGGHLNSERRMDRERERLAIQNQKKWEKKEEGDLIEEQREERREGKRVGEMRGRGRGKGERI